MQYEKNSFLLVLTFMVVVTVQRLPIWISGVKKKKRLSGDNGFMRALV